MDPLRSNLANHPQPRLQAGLSKSPPSSNLITNDLLFFRPDKFSFSFPDTSLSLRQTRVGFGVIRVLAEELLSGFLKFARGCDEELFVRFDEHPFARRLFEAEEQRAFARK